MNVMNIADCIHYPLVLSLLLVSAGCTVTLQIEGDGASASVTGEPTGTGGPVECVPPDPDATGWVHVSAGTGSGWHQFDAVAIDASGDIYAAGYASGELMMPGMDAAITLVGKRPIVAKFDCAGDLLWIATGQASGTASAYAIILSVGEQSVYVGGESDGSLEFAGTAAIDKGAYVARLDAATGAAQASVALGDGATLVRALAVGADGTVYAAGRCKAARAGILVAELQPNLEMTSVRCTSPIASATEAEVAIEAKGFVTEANGVSVLADGGLIVGGRLTGDLEGVDMALPDGAMAGFVARLATRLAPAPPAGEWFVLTGVSTGSSRVNAVAVLDDGSVVAGGMGVFDDGAIITGQVCGTPCESPMYSTKANAFLARLDAKTGACMADSLILCSGATAGQTASEEVFALAPTADGLYVTGQFSDSLVFDGVAAASPESGIRMFAARLTPALALDQNWMVSSDHDGDTLCTVAENETEKRSRVYARAVTARGGQVAIAGSACGTMIRVGPHGFATKEAQHHAFVARLSAP